MEKKKWYKNPWIVGLIVLGLFIVGSRLIETKDVREQQVAAYDYQKANAERMQNDSALQEAYRLGEIDDASLERKRKAKDLFGFGNGESRKLSRAIKKTMHDPDSYEHVETRHEDKGDHILVQTKFRGSNAYGAKVINTMTVKMDIEGNVLEVVE